MSIVIGPDTKVAIAKQTARGTAATLGAGHRVHPLAPITWPADYERTWPVDLAGGYTETPPVKGRAGKVLTLKLVPYMHGAMDFVGTLLGASSAGTQTDTTGAYTREHKHSATLQYYTIGFDTGLTTENLVKFVDAQLVKIVWKIRSGEQVEMETTWFCPSAPTKSTTSTSAWSFAHTAASVGLPGILHGDHFEDYVWLAAQGDTTFDASDAVCPAELTLTIDNGLGTEQPSLCGELAGYRWERSPETTAEMTLASWSDWTHRDRMTSDIAVKLLIRGVTDHGAPGTSVSDSSPSTDLSGGTDDSLTINLDGDGAQEIDLGDPASLTTGTAIAAAIQTAVRALTPADEKYRAAYTGFVCTYDTTVSGKYFLQAGDNLGSASSVVVTDAASNNCADDLKLGTGNGGTETAGVADELRVLIPTCYIYEFNPGIEAGRTQPTLKLRAHKCPTSAVTGFTSGDYGLESDFAGTDEGVRIVTVNRQSTAPV